MITTEEVGIRIQHRLEGILKPTRAAAVETSWRRRVAARLDWLASRLRGEAPPDAKAGNLLAFNRRSYSLGRPVYSVISRRGGLYMGTLEWSNQWGRPRFKADPEALFDPQCIAEIFVMMKEFR